MNMPGFINLSAFWLLFLAIPLIIFYFLKLKRPHLAVSSLALWQKVLADKRVNSPFQRFKRNILLFIQLLLLILIILALAQPYIRSNSTKSDNLPILIDCSASMAAVDDKGVSRLQIAKKRIAKIINNLRPNQKVALIAFSNSTHTLTRFTNNKVILSKALKQLKIKYTPSNISSALQTIKGLSQAHPIKEVFIFSDGNFPNNTNVELSFNINYQLLPAAIGNVGITEINARRLNNTDWELFVSIHASQTQTAKLDIYIDDKKVNSQKITIAKNENQKLIATITNTKDCILKAVITPNQPDSLSADNIAYLHLTTIRPLRIFAPKHLVAFRKIFAKFSNSILLPTDKEENTQTIFDLAIITNPDEDEIIKADTKFFINIIPKQLTDFLSYSQKESTIIDWKENSKLLRYTKLTNIFIQNGVKQKQNITETEFENKGFKVLCTGSQGPLILQNTQNSKNYFYLLFSPEKSTLYYRIAFPVMVSNLVQIAMQQNGLDKISPQKTGILSNITIPQSGEYTIKYPDGKTISKQVTNKQKLEAIIANQYGIYTIKGKNLKYKVGVSLLNDMETSLIQCKKIIFKENLTVNVTKEKLKTRKNLWQIIAIISLGLLLIEWWYYHHKSAG